MLSLFSTVLASPGDPIDLTPAGTQFAPLGNVTVAAFVSALIVLILVVAALAFFFLLVYGGVRYIVSGGDKAQAESARGTITAALIGLVIVFAAWAIVNLVSMFFGIDLLQLNIEPITVV